MEKKIYFVDASLLKQSACMLRVWRMGIEGYRSKINSVDIEYGQAFHQFAQEFVNTKGDFKTSVTKAVEYFSTTPYIPKLKKDWMNVAHLKKTCFDWMQHWESTPDNLEPLRVEGMHTTELKFDIPYYQNDLFEIHLCGTIDKICRTKGNQGPYCIVDYKTTSSWAREEYFDQYRLDPQLRFYRLAIKKYAELYPTSIFAEMVTKGCGAMIEGVFLANNKDAIIQRSDAMFFKAPDMEMFERMLNDFIDNLVRELSCGPTPYKQGILNGACNSKFGCDYSVACGAPDSIAEQHVLRHSFKQVQYNPLSFH